LEVAEAGSKARFIKILPLDYIAGFFAHSVYCWDVLAVWFAGDGYWDSDGNCFMLCTDNFTKAEVDRLCELLAGMGVKASPRKRKENMWRIRFSSHATSVLYPVLKDKLHPDMQYKLAGALKYLHKRGR
jgi:hypothetical protein